MAVDLTAVVTTAVAALVAVASPVWADAPSGQGESRTANVANAGEVPCIPVATEWPASSSGPYQLKPPQLAVATTDIRPKGAVVLLDGRPAARSRFFNGKKGFLYLEPGIYRLELEHDGFRAQAFEIAARPGCRFDIRHRMERARGEKVSAAASGIGKGRPSRWIWDPVEGAEPPADSARSRGPDLNLRPDLATFAKTVPERGTALGSLELRVTPATASIYLDGAYLASAREVSLMVSPLAIPAGQHVVEARAPGFDSQSRAIVVTEGDHTALELTLDEK